MMMEPLGRVRVCLRAMLMAISSVWVVEAGPSWGSVMLVMCTMASSLVTVRFLSFFLWSRVMMEGMDHE